MADKTRYEEWYDNHPNNPANAQKADGGTSGSSGGGTSGSGNALKNALSYNGTAKPDTSSLTATLKNIATKYKTGGAYDASTAPGSAGSSGILYTGEVPSMLNDFMQPYQYGGTDPEVRRYVDLLNGTIAPENYYNSTLSKIEGYRNTAQNYRKQADKLRSDNTVVNPWGLGVELTGDVLTQIDELEERAWYNETMADKLEGSDAYGYAQLYGSPEALAIKDYLNELDTRGIDTEQGYREAKRAYDNASNIYEEMTRGEGSAWDAAPAVNGKTELSHTSEEIAAAFTALKKAEERLAIAGQYRYRDLAAAGDYAEWVRLGREAAAPETASEVREEPESALIAEARARIEEIGGEIKQLQSGRMTPRKYEKIRALRQERNEAYKKVRDLTERQAERAESGTPALTQSDTQSYEGADLAANIVQARESGDKYRPLGNWTREEENVYYALIGQGRNDDAKDYALRTNNMHADISRSAEIKAAEEKGRAGGFGSNIGAVLASTATMPVSAASWIGKMQQVAATGDVLRSDTASLEERAEGYLRGRALALNETYGTFDEGRKIIGGKGLGDILELGTSIVQSLVYGNLGGELLTLPLFFFSAANRGYDEAINRGATNEQAAAYSVLTGAAEVLGEKLSLDNLLNAQAVKSIGLTALRQAGIEGSEELMTTALNILSDTIVNADKSEMGDRVWSLMVREGLSFEDASRRAWRETAESAAWDFIGGALSGGVSSGIQQGVTAAGTAISEKRYEKFKTDVDTLMTAQREYDAASAVINDPDSHTAEEIQHAETALEQSRETIDRLKTRFKLTDTESRGLADVPKATERIDVIEDSGTGRRQVSGTVRSWHFDTSGTLLATMETDGGDVRTVKAEEAHFDTGTDYLVQQARQHADTYGEAMLNEYTEGQSPVLYSTNFEAVAELYGASTDMTQQQSWEYSRRNGAISYALTRKQFNTAFELGRKMRSVTKKTVPTGTGTGRVRFEAVSEGGISFAAATSDMVDEGTVFALEKLAQLTGVDIVFYQSAEVNGRYRGANGFYRDGTVYLDVHAGANMTTEHSAVLLTAAHELTHHIRANNEEGYRQLRDFVIEHLIGKDFDIAALARRKIANSSDPAGMSYEDAVEEIVADACEEMLDDSSFAVMMAEEKPELARSIGEWLGRFAAKIKAAVSKDARRHAEAVAMREFADELQDIWDRALVKATLNSEESGARSESGTPSVTQGVTPPSVREASGTEAEQKASANEQKAEQTEDVRYSTRNFSEQVDEIRTGSFGENNQAYMGTTPPRLSSILRLPKLPMLVTKKHVTTMALTEDEAKADPNISYDPKAHYHGLGWDAVKELPTDLNRPLLIIKSNTDPDSADFVVITGKMKNGKEAVMCAVKPNGKGRYIGIEFNENAFLSGYGKNNIQNYVSTAAREGRILYAYKNSQRNNNLPGVQFPDHLMSADYGDSLAQFRNIVNEKFAGTTFENGKGLLPNTEYAKASERDSGDLQKKYPALDLNEDISQLDGVPAIRLTDGSVIPLPENAETGRRYTHIEFIKANRIDIDDIESGGWIGNGVYDESFQSDTGRYVETEQARKRMAEKRGETYEQFRYSNRDVTDDDTAYETAGRQASYATLRRQNELLRKRVEYWKGQTRTTRAATVREKDVKALAKELLTRFESSADREKITHDLQELGDYIVGNGASEEGMTWEEVYDRCREIAYSILVDTYIPLSDDMAEDRARLVSFLKAHPIDVSGLKAAGETDADFFRRYKEIKTSTLNGESIDTVYSALREEFGEIFPEDVPEGGDMLETIAQYLDGWAPIYGNPYEKYMGEATTELANEILDTMLSEDIRETPPTKADRAQSELEREKARYEELRQKSRQRIEEIKEQGRARREEDSLRYRAEKEKNAELKKHYEKRMKDATARRNASKETRKYRERVYARCGKLRDMIISNTDKLHINNDMRQIVGDFINAIDLASSKSGKGEKGETKRDVSLFSAMTAMNEMLSRQRKYVEGSGESTTDDVFLDIDDLANRQMQELTEYARQITNTGRTYTVADMDAEELKALDTILANLTKAIRDHDTAYNTKGKARISTWAGQTMDRLDKLSPLRDRSKLLDKAASFAFWENTVPYYAFMRLGEGGRAIFRGLQDGWDKLAVNGTKIVEFTEGLYTAEEAREWQRDIHTITLTDGSEMQITTAQIMSLWCLYKREQAKLHLNGGGLRVGNIEEGAKTVRQTEHYKLSFEDYGTLFKLLSERQKKVADTLQSYMSNECAAWGNEVSRERFGYDAFTEDNYFPIVTDSNDRAAVDPEAKANDMFRLLNMSATKALNPKANNALVVGDIFRVFSDHAADMAKYNALALPILNMVKWYNYKDRQVDKSGQVFTATVQKSIERAYGDAAKRYMVQFIKDLNGVHESGSTVANSAIKKILSRYKAASVGANVRVVVQQPTSYVRAAMVLEPKYLAKGLKPKKGDIEEMLTNSGIARWKDMGLVSTDIGRGIRERIMHTENVLDKAQDAAMAGAEWADKLTWACLWRAAKAKAEAETESGDTMERAKEIFREAVYATQVVDATMTRSHAMRNPGVITSMTTAYMAEPTLSYNILLNAYAELQEVLRSEPQRNSKELKEKLAQAFGAFIVTTAASMATVTAASLWDTVRDDDEYESFLQKLNQALWGERNQKWYQSNTMQEMLILNKIPVIKDIWSIFNDETVDRMDMQAIQNLAKAWKIDRDAMDIALGRVKSEESKYGYYSVYGKVMQNLKALSQLSGLPFYNLVRDAVGIYNKTLASMTGAGQLRISAPDTRREIRNAYANGYLSDEEAVKLLLDKGEADDRDQAFWIMNEWNGEDGQSETMKKLYESVRNKDTKSYDELMSYLSEHGVSQSTARNEIRKQIRTWYQGTEREKATISKADALALVTKYGGKEAEDAEKLVEQWTCLKVTGIDYNDIAQEYLDGNITEARARELLNTYGYGVYDRLNGKDKEDALKKTEERIGQLKCKKETGLDYEDYQEYYGEGTISLEEVRRWLIDYGGKTEELADIYTRKAKFIGADSDAYKGMNYYCSEDYYKYADGIDKKIWYEAYTNIKSLQGEDLDGDGRNDAYTAQDKKIAAIDALDLTPQDKTRLAAAIIGTDGELKKATLKRIPW